MALNIEKIKKDAYEEGQEFRRNHPDSDCSQPDPAGGWTDGTINAIGSEEFAREYGVTIDDDGEKDSDEWDQLLNLYEAHAQKGWDEALD
jgi:hypothetical protein